MKYNLGALPSPEDKRDLDLGAVQPPIEIPDVYLPDIDIPYNWQNGQPCCGAGAGSHLKEVQELSDSGRIQLSIQYLWDKVKEIDGVPASEGTYMRAVFKALQKFGIAPERYYPSNVKLDLAEFTKDKSDMIANFHAKFYSIKNYAFIQLPLCFKKLKQAIYKNKVVMLRILLDDGYWGTEYPTFTKPIYGHFVIATGYSKNSIRILCSADKKYPVKYIRKEYIGFIKEAGTAVDLPTWQIKMLFSEVSILKKLVKLLIQVIHIVKGHKKS